MLRWVLHGASGGHTITGNSDNRIYGGNFSGTLGQARTVFQVGLPMRAHFLKCQTLN